MNDEIDDNDDLDLEDSSFDDFDKKDQTLGDLWRNNPMIKIGALVGGGIFLIFLIFFFGRTEDPVDQSYVTAASEIKAPPGTDEASPAYVAAVEEENEARIEEAFREGSSALPTPIDPPVGRLEVPNETVEEEDPLQRWRKLQEERLQRELQQSQTIEQTGNQFDQGGQNQAVAALAEAMSAQMQAILESQSTDINLRSVQLTDPSFLEKLEEDNGNNDQNNDDQNNQKPRKILVPAGEIVYAQFLTEANSDVPGPVLAQIVSGPLRGSRVLGSFEVQQELLTVTFDTIVIDGISESMNGIALNPDTTLPAMATDVDHRYFKRIILPAAAAFVEGAASAIAESGLTTITIQGDTVTSETEETDQDQEIASGVEEAGQELREILDEIADDTEILVRIEAGTPMGILLLEPVFEPDPEDTTQVEDNNDDNPLAGITGGL